MMILDSAKRDVCVARRSETARELVFSAFCRFGHLGLVLGSGCGRFVRHAVQRFGGIKSTGKLGPFGLGGGRFLLGRLSRGELFRRLLLEPGLSRGLFLSICCCASLVGERGKPICLCLDQMPDLVAKDPAIREMIALGPPMTKMARATRSDARA